jgi:putative beta-lysine N-acetyltransferase
MWDREELVGHSIIQHGKYNDRIYLMKLAKEDHPDIIKKLDTIAKKNKYGKIFAKIPRWALKEFHDNNYRTRAYIPKFYDNKIDAYFVSKFTHPSRAKTNKKMMDQIQEIINLAKRKSKTDSNIINDFQLKPLTKANIDQLANIYGKVFKTYPFPIFDPEYLEKAMNDNVSYFGVFDNGQLIAASSAEIDEKGKNVEMTDFATLPSQRNQGLASELLTIMEREVKKRKIKTAYTIARSISPGMNITFAKKGYQYSGTLINNTNISGKIECMNVWHKKIK